MGTQYLKDIFAEKLLKDEREPVLTFEIPGWEGTFGLFAPLWEPWKQLILVSKREKRFDIIYLWILVPSHQHPSLSFVL